MKSFIERVVPWTARKPGLWPTAIATAVVSHRAVRNSPNTVQNSANKSTLKIAAYIKFFELHGREHWATHARSMSRQFLDIPSAVSET